MVTVKRQKKRGPMKPAVKRALLAGLLLAVLMLAVGITGLSARATLRTRMDSLGEYMARSIRTDLSQTLQCYSELERKNDTAPEQLAAMKKFMYSAFNMNKLLIEARGDTYSILDSSTYNSFQTTVGEYERLLETGQATGSVKTTLSDLMKSIENILTVRFDSADLLLPQSAVR